MNLLAINTSTRQYSLAVLRNEVLLGEYILPPRASHYSDLLPSLHELLSKVGLEPQELHGLIAAVGPGSFTGIRVGLSVAKGFCQSLDIPVIGVPTLYAMASQLPYLKEDICPLVASRKGEVFAALFRWNSDGHLTRIKQDTCLRMSELACLIEGKTVFIGNNLATQGSFLRQHFGAQTLLAPAHEWNLKASSIGILGLQRLREGDSDNLDELVPIYLRGADIRLPRTKFP